MSGNDQVNVSSPKRPKPPPKPKPSLVAKPTPSTTKTMPGKSMVSKVSATQNVKPARPALPIRPPSIKKLKEAARRKDGPVKQSSTESINDADKKGEDLELAMPETVLDTSSKNNEVISGNSQDQDNFQPLLIRTMSVPVSPHADESLEEKKRSISLIKEEDIKSISPKPLPKPRNISKTNFEKGRPIPPPRSKLQRMKSSELPKTGSSVNMSKENKSEEKVYPEQEKLGENFKPILPETSDKTLEKPRGSDAPKSDTLVTVQPEMKADEKVIECAPAVPPPSSDKVSITGESLETQESNSFMKISTEMESKEQASLKQEVEKGFAFPSNFPKKGDENTEELGEYIDLNYPKNQTVDSESPNMAKAVGEDGMSRDKIVQPHDQILKTKDTKQVKHHEYENVVISKEEKPSKNVNNISPRKQANPYENVSGPLNDSKANQNTEISEKTEEKPSKQRRGYENISLNKRSDKEDRNDEDTRQIGNFDLIESRSELTEVKHDVSLDFKHLRIDADDYDDDYAVPLHDSQLTDDTYSIPSPQKGNIDEISDNLYQSPKASPVVGARKSLFGNVAQIESPDKTTKRIRRPAPQPPMLDKNYNVLRSKVTQAEPNQNKEHREKDSEMNDLQTDYENIYTSPTSHPAEDCRMDYENVVGEKQPLAKDEFIDHIYKEPDNHADILPIGRKSSELSNASDFELFDPHAHNEYVEPSSLPKSDELVSNTVISRNSYASTDSSRSSVAIKEVGDSEYMEMSDQLDRTSSSSSGRQKDEKEDLRDDYVDMNEHLKTNETAQSKDSGDEYVDMSDNSPAVSPVKEIRPKSNVYLQPLTKQEKTYVIPKRPAPPPPPIRPSRKLPSVPTISYAKDDLHLSSDSDSLDGHYERIHSLRREMGLPIPELDEDYSDSETDSEDEEKTKEMTDDDKAKGKLYHIANEILTTEKTFVDALKLVCDDFGSAVRQMLQKDPSALPKNAYAQIFSDIELIYELDKKFLQDLGERMKEWDKHLRIGDIIREYSHFLKMYTNYIRGYDKTMAVFQDVYSKMPKFAALVKEYERNPSFKNLKITSYMLKPIQRIPSYRLLLVDYLKHLPPDDEDYEDISNGLKIVSAVANQINESMKEGEKFQAMLRLQSRIINNKEIVKPGRHLLKEGVLYKLSRKEAQERMFFLLTDCLFYCENAAGHNQYKLRQELPLADMSLVVPDTIDFIKELTIISTKRSFTLVASTPEERDEWATALRSAIDDVSKKIGTFACKLDHSDKAASPLKSPTHELGRIAPRWVPDDRATMCSICCRRFTTYNRRHHCRACGEIVCKDCSSFEAPLYYLDLEAARVCEKCYHHLYNSMVDENVTETDAGSNGEVSGTKLKRSRSSVTGKFRIVKKPKRDKKDRKTLPSKFTEVNVHEQDKNMSGYLWIIKKKKQKKRWFVLKDHVLYTYKAPSDPAANFTQPVLGYDVKVTGNFDNDDFVFQLEHKGLKEPLVYRADNRTSADKWVSLLKEASELEVH